MKTTKETTRKGKIEVEVTTVKGDGFQYSQFTIYEVRYEDKDGETVIFTRTLTKDEAEKEKQIVYSAGISEVAWIREQPVYFK